VGVGSRLVLLSLSEEFVSKGCVFVDYLLLFFQPELIAQFISLIVFITIPCSSNGEESACNTGNPGSIPGSGRSSGEGNDNPFQYFCLENLMVRGP